MILLYIIIASDHIVVLVCFMSLLHVALSYSFWYYVALFCFILPRAILGYFTAYFACICLHLVFLIHFYHIYFIMIWTQLHCILVLLLPLVEFPLC